MCLWRRVIIGEWKQKAVDGIYLNEVLGSLDELKVRAIRRSIDGKVFELVECSAYV